MERNRLFMGAADGVLAIVDQVLKRGGVTVDVISEVK
jgi:hypothetical protein